MDNYPDINDLTALLIVDVQSGFMNMHTDHLPPRIENLQKRYKTILATQFVNLMNSAFRQLLQWPRMTEGDDDMRLAFDPAPYATICQKDTYGSLPVISPHLDHDDILAVHIAGCDTNMCVMTAAIELFDTHRITPFILADYCASHSGSEYHESGLRLLEKAIGTRQIVRGEYEAA